MLLIFIVRSEGRDEDKKIIQNQIGVDSVAADSSVDWRGLDACSKQPGPRDQRLWAIGITGYPGCSG